MTALDTLIANSLELSTIGCELYSTTTCLDSVDDDLKGTSLCTTVTTVLDSINIPADLMAVRDAQSYVQSMSAEELAEFDRILAEKQLEFEISEEKTVIEETSKTYKKL